MSNWSRSIECLRIGELRSLAHCPTLISTSKLTHPSSGSCHITTTTRHSSTPSMSQSTTDNQAGNLASGVEGGFVFAEETTCFVCREYITDPEQVAGCYHILCRECLDHWARNVKEFGKEVSCPECKGKLDVTRRIYSFGGNRNLGNGAGMWRFYGRD